MTKDIRVRLTDKQLQALHDAAANADITVSDVVRNCLIKSGVIPDDEIQRGGYRERKPKDIDQL